MVDALLRKMLVEELHIKEEDLPLSVIGEQCKKVIAMDGMGMKLVKESVG